MLCIVLILIILLQPGKDSAAIFGGGQGGNKMYGVRSNANPLGRATTTIAVLFMVTSITLAWYSSASAQEDSGLKDALLKEEKIVNAKEIKFEVQKVYGITPFDLVKKPEIPTEINENIEKEAPPPITPPSSTTEEKKEQNNQQSTTTNSNQNTVQKTQVPEGSQQKEK